MMKLFACAALAFATTQAVAQYAPYTLRSSYPDAQVSRASFGAAVTYPSAPWPLIPRNVYRLPLVASLSFGPLTRLDDPCSPNEPYLYRALPFAMSCENWDAEQSRREHFQVGLRDPEEINRFPVAFRMP
jgi:hypothetical protein